MNRIQLSAVVCLSCAVLHAWDWANYKPTTISEAWSRSAVLATDYTVEKRAEKYVVETVFTGEHRDLTPERRKLIVGWAKAVGQPKNADLFDFEIEVKSSDKAYWLPIQNTLLEPFVKEVATGSRLKLYIAYIGAVKDDRVFLANEFEALR